MVESSVGEEIRSAQLLRVKTIRAGEAVNQSNEVKLIRWADNDNEASQSRAKQSTRSYSAVDQLGERRKISTDDWRLIDWLTGVNGRRVDYRRTSVEPVRSGVKDLSSEKKRVSLSVYFSFLEFSFLFLESFADGDHDSRVKKTATPEEMEKTSGGEGSVRIDVVGFGGFR